MASSSVRSVAILELVDIHAGVGGGEQRGAVVAVLGIEGDADADADAIGIAAGQADRLGHAVPDTVGKLVGLAPRLDRRSEEHTSELQSLMRISYAVFCLKKKTNT